MNRFQIKKSKVRNFEDLWKERDTQLKNAPGFVEFCLLKGKNENDITLYISHTVWENRKYFLAWTKSEEFRKAHKGVGKHNEIYVSHPKFEGFKVIL